MGGYREGDALRFGEEGARRPIAAQHGPRGLVLDAEYRPRVPVVEIVEMMRCGGASTLQLLRLSFP